MPRPGYSRAAARTEEPSPDLPPARVRLHITLVGSSPSSASSPSLASLASLASSASSASSA